MKKILSLMLAVLMLVGCGAAFTSCSKKETIKIGVQSGTTGECFLKGDADWGFDGYENVETKSYNNGALAVKDLLAGKIDYVVIDAAVAKSLVASNKGTKVIDYALTREDFGIGVDKNQMDLLNSINTILEENQDEIAAIYAKYADVNDDNSAEWTGTTVTSAEYDASRNQLVVATNAAFAPYEFKVGDAYAGIDMEMAQLIATELGMELVIVDMDFEAVVSSVGKNGIDVAISGLTINPARRKSVNFTDPYERGSYQVIIARSDDKTFDDCKSAKDVLAILDKYK
ncbi:MAG: transporter substrate-binding domain-containing protein [Clostridia bacterium]|nr:transporter substrate-binding domain-containing protein [Clostridia bacterium]